MPPFAWWLRGREHIGIALGDPRGTCEGARLWPVEANGSPAFWQTRPGPDGDHVVGLGHVDDPASLVSGVIVLVLGLVLMLDQAGVWNLRFDYWWPLAFAALGGVLLACGLAGPRRR